MHMSVPSRGSCDPAECASDTERIVKMRWGGHGGVAEASEGEWMERGESEGGVELLGGE